MYLALATIALMLAQAQTPGTPGDQAIALYQQHKYKEAAVAFEELGGEDNPQYTAFLGQSLFLSGQYDKAIPVLEKAARGTSLETECAYMLATTYLRTQQPDKSVGAFALVFGLKPDSAAAHLAAAQMMLRGELLDYAEKQLRQALALDARIPQAHYELGVIALSRGDADSAITDFQKEIAVNPAFAMTYYRLGDAFQRQENWDKAISSLQRSIWLNPAYSGPYILLGKVYLHKNQLANAEGVLRHAVQMDTQNRSAHYLLGQTLVSLGRTEEGRKFLKRSLELGSETDQ